MSTPLRIGEIRSLDVFTGIILTVDQVPEHNSKDLVKDFTEVGKEYEKRAFNVDRHNITAVMIPCKLIFNYYGPVMLVPPSGRAWLAEQDFSRIIQQHKGDYDKVLSIMGNDLVDAAYET